MSETVSVEAVKRVLELLDEYTMWSGGVGAEIDPIKPNHGHCCTCQKCGRDYDSCVCDHNAIQRALDSIGLGQVLQQETGVGE